MKKLIIKSSITILVAGVLFVIVAWIVGAFGHSDRGERYIGLSNSAFVIGVLLTCIGLLAVVSGQGAYHSISYSLQRTLSWLPIGNKDLPKTLYDYKQLKSQQPSSNIGHLLIAGIVWIGVAVVFMLVG
jgi:hypothetical protein